MAYKYDALAYYYVFFPESVDGRGSRMSEGLVQRWVLPIHGKYGSSHIERAKLNFFARHYDPCVESNNGYNGLRMRKEHGVPKYETGALAAYQIKRSMACLSTRQEHWMPMR